MTMSAKAVTIPLAASLMLLATTASARRADENRSMDSIHQPVVSHASYAYDLRLDSGGGVDQGEIRRLDGWLRSLGLGYGDHVALDAVAAGYRPGLRDDIADLVATYGLLLDADAAIPGGPDGSVRVTVRRAIAQVPGCPDWSTTQESYGTALSSNFGCGVNSNLAAMIANPEDLVRGQVSNSDLRVNTATRAIQTYQKKEPTGTGELKTLSGGGK